MDSNPAPSFSEQFASITAWWADAGVDCDYSDAPQDWLTEDQKPSSGGASTAPASTARVVEEPQAPRIGGDRTTWPTDLNGFRDWWMAEPSLDLGGVSRRIPPTGTAGAEWMILVPEPSADDVGELHSGSQGRFLASMLNAMQIDRASCYFASALPRPVPLVMWGDLANQGLAEITRHHIALVRPKRLIALGQDVLPLLGHDPAQNPLTLREVNHEYGQTPVIIGRRLAVMMDRPAERARFWKRWIEWTEQDGL